MVFNTFEKTYPTLWSMRCSDDKVERCWVNKCLNKLKEINKYNETYLSRLEEEARVKKIIGEKLQTNMFSYPLTLQHYCDLFWKCGSIVGAGRGSSCSGLNHYLLGITQLDPIEWELPFWRYNIEKFLEKTDEILAQYPDEACYHVDYLWEGDHADGQIIEDIAGYGFLWGKDMPESKVGIKNLKITKDNISLKSADKNPTLCITLPECEIIKFGSSKEEYESLRQEDGFTTINLVGTCGKNEWMGTVTPQIMLEDYEIVNSSKYYF